MTLFVSISSMAARTMLFGSTTEAHSRAMNASVLTSDKTATETPAAAIRPVEAGRSPYMAPRTYLLSLKDSKNLAMHRTRMTVGMTMPKVAMTAPTIPSTV